LRNALYVGSFKDYTNPYNVGIKPIQFEAHCLMSYGSVLGGAQHMNAFEDSLNDFINSIRAIPYDPWKERETVL
jgi:hypothetical protein